MGDTANQEGEKPKISKKCVNRFVFVHLFIYTRFFLFKTM